MTSIIYTLSSQFPNLHKTSPDFCVVIASAVIVLAWLTVLTEEERKKSEDRRFARFSDFYRSGTSATFTGLVLQQCSSAHLTVPLPMEALSNACYGSWRPLTNLTETFQACHLRTFNVAAIFFLGHPYKWRTTVHHNTS